MKKQLLIRSAVVILVLLIVGYLAFMRPWLDDRIVSVTVDQTIVRPDLGISFKYPSGQDAYTLIEPLPNASSTLKQAFIIMPTQEYIHLQSTSTEAKETPAALTLFVYELPEEPKVDGVERAGRITRLQNWAQANQNITSINLAQDTPEITEIDGLQALRYTTDGLYQQDIYIATYKGLVYLFVGQYDGEADPNKEVFQALINSVLFE